MLCKAVLLLCSLSKQLLVSLHHHAGAAAEGLMSRTAEDQALLNLKRGQVCRAIILMLFTCMKLTRSTAPSSMR